MKEFDKTKDIPLFREEVGERIHKISTGLLALEKDTRNKQIILDLQRQAHTIKGTSFMLGFTQVGQISHQLEENFSLLLDGKLEVSGELIEQVFIKLDSLKDRLEHLTEEFTQRVSPQAAVKSLEGFIKVPAERIERLSCLNWDISQKIKQLRQNLEDLKKFSVSVQGSEKIRIEIRALLKEFSETQDSLDLLMDEMQKSIQLMRLVSLSVVLEDFPRRVRDISNQEAKEIELLLHTGSVGIDRFIVEELKGCLTHILRNAIRHGIERPDERVKAGKPTIGRIKINCGHKNDYVFIEVEDDGRGINPQAVKEQAIKKGLIDEGQVRLMSEQELIKLVLLPGLSSSSSVDSLSGRGIGLDTVREDVERLGGKVDIESRVGTFTKVSLFFPLTVGLLSTLLVEQGDQVFAIPASFIQKSLEVMASSDLVEQNGVLKLKLDNSFISVVKLNQFFNLPRTFDKVRGLPVSKDDKEDYPQAIVILSSKGAVFGFMVNRILGQSAAVLKGFGRFLGKIKFLQGAGCLNDGRIALILDVPEIFKWLTHNHTLSH